MRDSNGKFIKGHNVPPKWVDSISKKNTGRKGWNKGIPMSEKTKNKLSKSLKGRPIWNKGIPWSDKIKEKLSKSHLGQVAWNKGKKMSKKCREKMSIAAKERIRTRKKVTFKSGKYTYYQLYKPEYIGSSKNGYIFEHRFVIENHLKRILKKEEVVHHINGDTIDNRIENLKIFPNNIEHLREHRVIARNAKL